MNIVAIILAMITILMIHYNTKVFVAYKQGDIQIKSKMTFNPIKVIEPVGLILFFFSGFGWDKPLEVNHNRFKNIRKGVILTNIIPIIVLLLTGFISILILKFSFGGESTDLSAIPYMALVSLVKVYSIKVFIINYLFYMAIYSIAFALVNLLPIYPFDGYSLFGYICKPNTRMFLHNYEKVLQILFVFLLLLGIFNNIVFKFIIGLVSWIL